MRRRILFVLTSLFAIPVGVYLVGNAVGFFGKAGGVPANLLVDLSTSFPDSHFSWRNLAQGNEERTRMLAPVITQTQALHPNYIRIDTAIEDRASLDANISDILAIGAKPFIAITGAVPTDWGKWESSVQELVEHVSGKSGLNISNVYYEVWNEPDLFGGYKLYGSRNYIELYAHTAAAAQRARNINSFKIGGPGTTALYENWVVQFLTAIVSRNLRVDFYSWHNYSKDLDKYERDLINIKSWLTERVQGINPNLELAITELGPNSNNDPVYDNGFGGVHALATSAVMEDSVNKVFNFEIKDGPGESQYWGRWGILTHEKFGAPVAKPRYNALAFLNRMTGNRVNIVGEGSWIKAFSKKDGKVIRTFVVNYDIEGKHVEAVPITFQNIPLGTESAQRNFRFRRINYGGAVVKDISVATSSAVWQTFELMNPNTAAIMEITLP